MVTVAAVFCISMNSEHIINDPSEVWHFFFTVDL